LKVIGIVIFSLLSGFLTPSFSQELEPSPLPAGLSPSFRFKITRGLYPREDILTLSMEKNTQKVKNLHPPVLEKANRMGENEIRMEIMGGTVSDNYGKQVSGSAGVGFEFQHYFNNFFLDIQSRYAIYPQEYYFITPANELNRVAGGEHLIGVDGVLGFQIPVGYRFKLSPIAGVSGVAFILQDATNILLGPTIGMNLKKELLENFRINIRTSFTYDLFNESGDKPVGGFSYGLLDYSITFGLNRIFFGYRGEFLMFPSFTVKDITGVKTQFGINRRFYNLFFAGFVL